MSGSTLFEQILDPAHRANPYPLYAEMRRVPVARQADGTYVVSTHAELARLSRSHRASTAQVTRTTALLAVADGQSYRAAARQAGRRDGDTVAAWIARFNREGFAAVRPPMAADRPPARRQAAAAACPYGGYAGAGPRA